MISKEQIANIRRLFHAEHWKVGTIACELGLHPETVKRALETDQFKSRARRPLRTDPFLDFIEQTLKQHPRLRATRLFEMLRDRGYQGSVRQVRRLVQNLRPLSKEAFLRLSVLPGEHYGKCRAMLRRLLVIRSFPYCRRDCSDSCFP
jgi:transposase